MSSRRKKSLFGAFFLLTVATLFSYWPLGENRFVNVDDPQYIIENSFVNSGLSLAGVKWALVTSHACNWHPLTWISHMLDCSMFGLKPQGHHLVSLAIHLVNSLLLLGILHRITGARWRSFFVAALFALHPTHVESVAWASERKDVLSAFFFLLTIWAYYRYTLADGGAVLKSGSTKNSGSKIKWYSLAALFFVLALMSKPMVVTLPFVLLLLDFWPFNRFASAVSASGASIPTIQQYRDFFFIFARLTREKIPLFALSIGSCVITFIVQKAGGAVSSFSVMPLSYRIPNAMISYWRYIGKTVWPVNLSPIYVHPDPWPLALAIIAALMLLVVSVWAFAAARRYPWFLTGWFWFVGTLVPAIGIVQVGPQALADRYLYLPGIGLLIIVIWWAGQLLGEPSLANVCLSSEGPENVQPAISPGRSRAARLIVVPIGVSALAGCALYTWFQAQLWHDGETLYSHALDVDPVNYVALDYLGTAMNLKHRDDDALALFNKAVRLQPEYPEAQYNLGTLLLQHGILEGAITHLEKAIKLAPFDGNAHHNLGNAYLQSNRFSEAEREYREAVVLKPHDAAVKASLGDALLRQDKLAEAFVAISESLAQEPNSANDHRNLGIVLIRQGKVEAAVREFGEAVRLKPADTEMRFNFGLALLDNHQPREAEQQFREILRTKPDDTPSLYRLAIALHQLRKSKEAIAEFRAALRWYPEFPEALNELAWLLATDSDDLLRNGAEAISLASKACELTKAAQPALILTLAAAYGEAGQFDKAVSEATKARGLAETQKQKDVVAKSEAAIALFQQRKPFRDSP